MNKKDNIYSTPKAASPFRFDQNVAEVFPDMIKRSVPGYSEILKNIAYFAATIVTSNSHCYDLGCSLGAATLALDRGAEKSQANGVNIIGIDNSQSMLDRCEKHVSTFKQHCNISFVKDDIEKVTIQNASMVVLNFTLQFIAKEKRESVLKNIYHGLNPGGALILSEKIHFSDSRLERLLVDLHHQFKKENGYSELEVSQKRNALENVLLPETMESHLTRLKQVGFSSATCWFQHYNFVSIIAIK